MKIFYTHSNIGVYNINLFIFNKLKSFVFLLRLNYLFLLFIKYIIIKIVQFFVSLQKKNVIWYKFVKCK